MTEGLNNNYQTVFKYALNACFIVTEAGTVREANPAACSMFGYNTAEFAGANYNKFLTFNSDSHLLAFEEGAQFAAEGIHKNDNHFNCTCAISTLKSENEETIKLLEISEVYHKKSTGDVSLNLSMLESVVTNTTDPIMITAAHNTESDYPEIIYVNRAFSEMTGFTPADVLNGTIEMLEGPNTESSKQQKLKDAFRKQNQTVTELLYYKKNGEEFWVKLSLIPVFDDNGECSHFILIKHDITERKNRELIKTLQSDISRLFNEQNTVKDTVDSLLDIISGFGNFSLTEVWLLNENKSSISLIGFKTNDKSFQRFYDDSKRIQLFRKGEGMPGITWQKNETQFWQNLGDHEHFLRREAAKKSDIKTAYCIPIRFNEEVTGALLLGVNVKIDRPRYYMAFLQQLGEDIGDEIKRKQLEEELNRTFNFSQDVICISGMDGYFKKVNPALSRMLGYTQDELLSHPISSFTHPDDRIRTELEIDSINRGKGSVKFENRFLTKSGKVIWLSWTTQIFYEEGKIYSTARDVTEQKELQILLDQANRLAKIGSWEVDLVEGTLYWSDITKEIHEVEPDFDPDLEKGINFYKEGENRARIRQSVKTAIQDGIAYDLELQVITAKGNERWVRAIGEPEMVDGKCVRLYGSFQDIHEKKELQNLLDQTNRLAKVGSWELDLSESDNEKYWSEMTREILEVEEDYNPTLTGGFEFYKKESKEQIQRAVDKAIKNGESFDLELLITTAKGNNKWIRCIGEVEMHENECIRMYGSYQDINKRKVAELAYKNALEERTKILDSISDAFYAINENWKITYFNKEAEKLLGKSSEEVTGTEIWESFAPAKETKLYEIYKDVMESNESRTFEYYYPPLDSWFDISAYPAENGISVYFKNIDDRKESQRRILEKSQQLDAIAKFNGLLITCDNWKEALQESLEFIGKVIDADKVYYFQNDYDEDQKEKIATLELEWAEKDADVPIDHPTKQGVPFSKLEEFLKPLENKKPYFRVVDQISDADFRQFLKDQKVKSVLAIPVFVNHDFYGCIGFDDCKTKREWSEEEISFLITISINLASAIENEIAKHALQDAFKEKNEILESIGDAFVTIDKDWTVTYWNNVAENILNMPREKIIGENLWNLYEDAVESEFYRQYQKAVEDQVAVHFDEYYPGTKNWFEVSAYPSASGLSVFFRDITERKETEQQLKELNRSLEKQTKELAISNAELEQFAFVASHDLQEPLRMVTSFLAMLEKKYGEKLDDKAKQYINFATDGAKRMRQIILDLLEFSKIGHLETELSDIDINEVLDDVMILNRKLIAEKNAKITWESMPVIHATRSSMQQLFQNLITNALIYQEPGNEPIIKIWAEETDSHWKFYVRDNGIGINPEYSDKIFNIFQRLYTNEQYSGTGVGLAICKKIVEENGGQIGVDSEKGEGSVFYFTIEKRQNEEETAHFDSKGEL